MPETDNFTGDPDLDAGLVSAPLKRGVSVSHLPDLVNFANENKLIVGSTTGGRHNAGSKHYTGNAIDIKGSGAFSNDQVASLKETAAQQGFLVRDERTRPPRQKVWGGPHIHVEYAGDLQTPQPKPTPDADLEAGLVTATQTTQPSDPDLQAGTIEGKGRGAAMARVAADPSIALQPRGQQPALKTPRVTSTVKDDTGAPISEPLAPIQFKQATDNESQLSPAAKGAQRASENVRLQGMQMPSTHPDLLGTHVEAKFDHKPTLEEADNALMEQLGKGYGGLAQRFRDETGTSFTGGQAEVEQNADGSYSAHGRPTQGFIQAVNAYATGGRTAYENAISAQTTGRAAVVRDVQSELKKGEGVGQDLYQAANRAALKNTQFVQNVADLAKGQDPETEKNARAIAEAEANIPSQKTWTGTAADVGLGTAGTIMRAEATGGGGAFPLEQELENAQRSPAEMYKAGILSAPLLAIGPTGQAIGANAMSPVARQAALRGIGAAELGGGAAASGGGLKDIRDAAIMGGAFPTGARGAQDEPTTLRGEAQQSVSRDVNVDANVDGASRSANDVALPRPRASASEAAIVPELTPTPGSIAKEISPQGGPTDTEVPQGVRHVDLQSRRARNTESGNRGQFKAEPKSVAEERRAKVNTPAEPAATSSAVEPQNDAALPATASQPPPPEVSQQPTKTIPDWVREDIQSKVKQSDSIGVSDRIEELSAKRQTAAQVVDSLIKERPDLAQVKGNLKGLVHAVRSDRGIPSMDDATEFESWLKSRTLSQQPSVSVTEPRSLPVSAEDETYYRNKARVEAAKMTDAQLSEASKYFANRAEESKDDVAFQEGLDRDWRTRPDDVARVEEKYQERRDRRTPEQSAQSQASMDAMRAEAAKRGVSIPSMPDEEPLKGAEPQPLSQQETAKPAEATPVPEVKRAEPSTTSARKAQMSEDRAALDLPELPAAERKSWQISLENAKPEKAALLADEVLTKPRALNDEETASLVVRAQEIKNEHAQVMNEIGKATDSQQIKSKTAEAEALEREFDRLTRATKASGTEKGRSLASQKLTINQDFDLVSMIQRAKAAKGRDLTPEERARYESQATQIADLTKQLGEANERAKQAELQRQINKVTRQGRRAEAKSVLDDEFASLKASLAQAKLETRSGVQPSLLAGLDPEGRLTPIIAKMAQNRVKAGINSAEGLVEEVYNAVKEHYNITREEVAQVIRGTLHQSDDVLSKWDKRRQTQLLKQESELFRRLGERDFSSKAQREPPIYNRETLKLQKKIDQLKVRYNTELYNAQRGVAGRIFDTGVSVANIPKSVKSSMDISAVLRQGGFFSATHPIESAKAAADMFRSFSEVGFRNVEAKVKSHPDFDLAKKSGVEFTGVDKDLLRPAQREEAYLSALMGKVPGIKQSEQTFVSFLDSQRMNVFSRFAEQLRSRGITPESNPRAYKDIANFVNIGTGRGSLGRKGNQITPALNVLMFSPRLVASRVQLLNKMLNPVSWARMPKETRGLIMKDNVKFMIATAAALGLAKMAGATVNTDPDDADFLKIKVGNTRYDALAGMQQPMRFMYRMVNAMQADARSDETYAGEDKGKILSTFARSKASPLAGVAIDYFTGKDFEGRKFSAKREALDLVTPLPISDFVDAMKQEGLIKGAIKASPTLTGVGVQTYPQSPEKPATRAEKLARKFVSDSMPDEARTDEEIDKSKKISDLRARSRRGEDVSQEMKPLGLSTRQENAIERAKNQTRFQEDVKRATPEHAILIYKIATRGEQEQIKEILANKAGNISELPEERQAKLKADFAAIGLAPGGAKPRPKRSERLERPKRKEYYQFQ